MTKRPKVQVDLPSEEMRRRIKKLVADEGTTINQLFLDALLKDKPELFEKEKEAQHASR